MASRDRDLVVSPISDNTQFDDDITGDYASVATDEVDADELHAHAVPKMRGGFP